MALSILSSQVKKNHNLLPVGYKHVTLYGKYGLRQSKSIHRMVAEAFLPNPENKPCVNHKDGDKMNNHVSNLEWVTHKENTRHAMASGAMNNHGENHSRSKLKKDQVLEIRRRLKEGEHPPTLSQEFGVTKSTIASIGKRRTWKHI